MPRLYLFLVACFLSGLGGVLGSILGHAAGKPGLWIGGIIGGLLGAVAAAAIARRRRWIPHARFYRTAAGAMVGFMAAATLAVNTLSSPVGPILSTFLVGAGALIGAGPQETRVFRH
jgi:hypothetical protein